MNNAAQILGAIVCVGGGTILAFIILFALAELAIYIYTDVRDKFVLVIRGEKLILEYRKYRDDYAIYRAERERWVRAWIDAASASNICISPETIEYRHKEELLEVVHDADESL